MTGFPFRPGDLLRQARDEPVWAWRRPGGFTVATEPGAVALVLAVAWALPRDAATGKRVRSLWVSALLGGEEVRSVARAKWWERGWARVGPAAEGDE